MLILGIETSCDETSCAVLRGKDQILSNVVSSSLFRHKPFGGVVPEIASRHCMEQIDTVFQEAISEAGVAAKDLDLIAVTYGPGLIGSLLVGVAFAKALSYGLGIPLVGVNHLEAHLSANFIGAKVPKKFVGLLISGGHTSLSYHCGNKLELMGETVDDAVGEAFDKVAKILGLGYPGGPVIEKMAREGDAHAFKFTKPKQKNHLDFSFSGIKTAVRYSVDAYLNQSRSKGKRGVPSEGLIPAQGADVSCIPESWVKNLCASFQRTVTDWLLVKTFEAAQSKKCSDIVIGGGVSANQYIRQRFSQEASKLNKRVWFPGKGLTIDNAAMIARRGIEVYRLGKRSPLSLTGVPNLILGAKS